MMASTDSFANLAAVEIHARHPRLRGKGNEHRFVRRPDLASAQVVLFFRQHNNRPAFGRFVGERRELRGIGHLGRGNPRSGDELRCLAVAERDRSRLIEQQRVHVSGRFHGASRHCQHVVLHQAIHAGDADRGQQAANGGRNQADQQRDEHEYRLRRARVNREGLQRNHRQQKNDGQAGEQNVERDLVRSLLPFGALDQTQSFGRGRFRRDST